MNTTQRIASAVFHALLVLGVIWVIYATVDGFIN